jgi:hypothetical protein
MDATLNLTGPAWLAIGVFAATFLSCACTRLAPDMVFMGGLIVLALTGVVDTEDALAGFSNPGMLTVAFLYVVVAALQQTGGLGWISNHVLGHPRGIRAGLVRLMAPVMALSGFPDSFTCSSRLRGCPSGAPPPPRRRIRASTPSKCLFPRAARWPAVGSRTRGCVTCAGSTWWRSTAPAMSCPPWARAKCSWSTTG